MIGPSQRQDGVERGAADHRLGLRYQEEVRPTQCDESSHAAMVRLDVVMVGTHSLRVPGPDVGEGDVKLAAPLEAFLCAVS